MHFTLEVLTNTRKFLKNILDNHSLEAFYKIPPGFNNNILWNIGHVVVTQQLLAYKLSGLPMIVSKSLISKYMIYTKHKGDFEQLEVIDIKTL